MTCNDITEDITVMVTEFGSELIQLILGLDFCKLFNLVTMADVCIQRQISVEQQVEAVHIMDESEIDYVAGNNNRGRDTHFSLLFNIIYKWCD